jgi:hypothetical protein
MRLPYQGSYSVYRTSQNVAYVCNYNDKWENVNVIHVDI